MTMNPNDFAYKKLNGQRATHKQFAQKISTLSMGDISKGIPPMSQSEIMHTLGFKDRKSIRQYLNLAKELNLFDESKKDDFKIKEYKLLAVLEDFCKTPEMQTWITNMKSRARGGKPFGGLNKYLVIFKNVCDTLEIVPLQWISGANREEILKQSEIYMDKFIELYFTQRAKIKYGNTWTPKSVNPIIIKYSYSKPVRDFMRIHGYPYPEGQGGSMSQSIAPFHGKYASVRLTMEEYKRGQNFIVNEYGLDSDVFRWYSVGVEALPRKLAIHTMKNDYEIIKTKYGEFYSMEAYETKTSHYKGGKWNKLIFSDLTKKSINLVKERGNFIIEERKAWKATEDIYPKLRATYKFLNKTHLSPRIPNEPETSYWIEHSSHALRHIGAQIWLYMTKWNLEFVASMGWKKVQELSDSYGEMPAQMRIEILEDIRF